MTEPLPPGWYPDPYDPSRNMYWDGKTWHRNNPPAESEPMLDSELKSAPREDRKELSPQLVVVLIVLAGLAAASYALLVVLPSKTETSKPSSSSSYTQTPTVSAAPTVPYVPTGITGNTDSWLAAVCAPGRYTDGSPIPGAEAGGSCVSAANRGAIIQISQWYSQFKMQNAMTLVMQCYTTYTGDDGLITVFSVSKPGTRDPYAPLRPLKQFGFAQPIC